MPRTDPGLRDQASVRSALRLGGPIVFGIGLLLTAIALIDFFSSFGSFGGMPTNFWMAFIGLPMMGIGWAMIQAGYLGSATRYVAGEVAPTLRDTIGALGFGSEAACASCGAANDRTARFCAQCGKAMVTTCAACGAQSEPGARFCSGCGKEIAPA